MVVVVGDSLRKRLFVGERSKLLISSNSVIG